MRVLKITVAYDGTAFHGWQRQSELRTVQGELETALAAAMGGTPRVQGAGRTDAGCHARGQVASVATDSGWPVRAIAARLQRALPSDLQVREVADAPPGFDARRSASARRYSYRLLDRDDPLWGRFAWAPRDPVLGGALERATRVLEGEHDCSAFRAAGSSEVSPRCRIVRVGWRRWDQGWMLDLIADHFLYHMVRNIVGTALAVMRRDDPARAMRDVLSSGDRRRAGVTAPPQGLCLEEVFYAARAS